MMKLNKIYSLAVALTLTACQLPEGVNLPGSADTKTGSVTSPTNPTTPIAPSTPDANAKIALVYSGDGVCEEDCADAAAESARLAGLTPKLVTASSLSANATADQIDTFYKNAVVWIEPGGYARNSWEGMNAKMQSSLKAFIVAGGGYVGFCAGAFMATSKIGGTGAAGLGVFPGSTYPYSGTTNQKVTWLGSAMTIYWEGGPYFYNLPSTVEPTAYYPDDTVAAARTQYGSGRVWLSGPHPEAPGWWNSTGSSSSVKGPNQQLAADMIKWAARTF